jgi:hypothetical protein
MKSQLKISVVLATVVIFSVFASSFTTVVNAKSVVVPGAVDAKPAMEVKFLGATGEYLYFELSLNQLNDTRSQLRVRNEDGVELYAESVFSKATTRKLKIAKEDVDKLEFAYSNLKGEVKKTFEVKIRFQEAIEVKDITRP